MRPDPLPQEPPPSSRRGSFPRVAQWLRHHASSLLATAVDFLSMVATVELLHGSPVAGTVAGATLGAVTNFLLGRHWTYRGARGDVQRQAVRYLVVSAASLGLNAFGEYLLAHRLGLQYVGARVITATIVSNAWNYPMHRFFVFAAERRSPA